MAKFHVRITRAHEEDSAQVPVPGGFFFIVGVLLVIGIVLAAIISSNPQPKRDPRDYAATPSSNPSQSR